eukprot:Phypoly_transcript_14069.p1 GENE.Phypoly_transcript_14069~~Phypoly_transcript_14069.p1  ORF type:complete len:278 (+),score=37.18 Phypoly_transcript_14069:57-890(+)
MDTHLADTLRYLAEGLAYLAPVDADAQHFFLPAEVHVIQGLGFGLLCIITLFVSRFGTIHAPPKKEAPPLSTVEQLLRAVLTVNLLLQLVYKYLRGWKVLTYMLQPCHAATAIYLYALYTKDYRKGCQAFQIGLHYMFFTTLAIAVPDTTQLQLPFEVTNFWVQHYVLLITPLWLLASRRFELHPSWGLTVYAIGLGMVLHFFAQLPAALLSGVNVNYMLWPPPNVPFIYASHWWRVNFTLTFIPLAWMTGYLLPTLVLRMQRKELAKAKQHQRKHK